MIEKLKAWILRLSLNSLWEEEEEDDWEDFDMQDDYISGAEEDTEREAKSGVTPAIVYFVIVVLLVMAALSYMVFSHRHLYTGYSVTESYEGADVIGTSYLKIGGNFFKYGSDGVSMVNGRNELIWSNAYTMQTPTVDFTGQTLLIYEQQGYQVYLVDGRGIIGNFITDLPIMRGEVADNGVTALLLKNDRDCLIRMYSREGTQIAELRLLQMQDLQTGELLQRSDVLYRAARKTELAQQHMSADRREASQRLTDERELFQICCALEKAQIRDLAHDHLRAVDAAGAVFIEADVFKAVGHHVPAEMQLCDLRELPAVDRLVRYPERPAYAALCLLVRKADGEKALGLAEVDHGRRRDRGGAFRRQLLRDLRRRHGIPFPARQSAERSRSRQEKQQRRGQSHGLPGYALEQRTVIAPR